MRCVCHLLPEEIFFGCHKSLGSIYKAFQSLRSVPLKLASQFLTRTVGLPSGHFLHRLFSRDCEYFISLLKTGRKEQRKENPVGYTQHRSLLCSSTAHECSAADPQCRQATWPLESIPLKTATHSKSTFKSQEVIMKVFLTPALLPSDNICWHFCLQAASFGYESSSDSS